MISKIRVVNFKSFESIDVDLSDFNVVIGQNSSGKSNLVSIFKFIKDVCSVGLSNAISLQGGLEYLLNFNNSRDGYLEIEINLDKKQDFSLGGSRGIVLSDMSYKLQIHPFKRKKGIHRYVEEVTMKCSNTKVSPHVPSKIKITSENGKIGISGENKENINEILPFFLTGSGNSKKEMGSLIQIPPLSFFFGFGANNVIQIYDFDPKLSKRAIPTTGKAELESDGSNTALVLRKMLNSHRDRKRFIDYIKVCLPFVSDISVDNQVDKSVLFKISETYNSKKDIPAPIISDGTVEIISMIYALFFEQNKFIVIEEPERNIHPHLISNLMHLIQEASRYKQVIITTQSPEIIKYAPLEKLYIIDRDKNGQSKLSRASNSSEIKTFLREKIGVEDLFIDGILN